jgi:PAS domain S-box-containing protein
MKIRTQMNISIILFCVIAAAILILIVNSNIQIQEMQKRQQVLEDIQVESVQLNSLANDFILHGGIRPVEQWKSVDAQLSENLEALTFSDPDETARYQRLIDTRQELNTAFFSYVSVRERVSAERPDALLGSEVTEFTSSALAERTQTLISDSNELSRMIDNDAFAAHRENTLFIFLSLGVLLVFACLNYFLISRSVLRSLSAIKTGTDRIGSGDLDTRVMIESDNELGELAAAFNSMSSKLAQSLQSLTKLNADLNNEIIERKKSQDALKESEERFRLITTNTPDHIVEHDLDLRYTLVINPQLGLTREDMIGKTDYDILRTDEANHLVALKRGVLTTGIPRHTGFSLVAKDGKTEFFEGTYIPRRNAEGEINGLIGYFRNITERRQAEKALDQARKKLNTLTAVALQDIRSSVFSLQAYHVLLKKEGFNETSRGYLDGEDTLISDINRSLNFAKDFQDLGMNPPRWQNVEEVFIYAISHLKFLDISRKISLNGLEIYADPLLEKAFFHILQNSLIHSLQTTEVWIHYQEIGENILIIIEDNGMGVPHEEKEQIFERRLGDGSSLGLFLVREILSIMDMQIRETGEPGKGTRFEILVPKGTYRFSTEPPEYERES